MSSHNTKEVLLWSSFQRLKKKHWRTKVVKLDLVFEMRPSCIFFSNITLPLEENQLMLIFLSISRYIVGAFHSWENLQGPFHSITCLPFSSQHFPRSSRHPTICPFMWTWAQGLSPDPSYNRPLSWLSWKLISFHWHLIKVSFLSSLGNLQILTNRKGDSNMI